MLDCPKRYSPALLQHPNMFFSTQLPELVAAGLLIEGPIDIITTSRPGVALESLEPLPDDSTFLKMQPHAVTQALHKLFTLLLQPPVSGRLPGFA